MGRYHDININIFLWKWTTIAKNIFQEKTSIHWLEEWPTIFCYRNVVKSFNPIHLAYTCNIAKLFHCSSYGKLFWTSVFFWIVLQNISYSPKFPNDAWPIIPCPLKWWSTLAIPAKSYYLDWSESQMCACSNLIHHLYCSSHIHISWYWDCLQETIRKKMRKVLHFKLGLGL